MNFDGFVNDIIKNAWNVHGVEVYKKGMLIYSYKDTVDNTYDIYSATKTITSLAAGLAYDRGLIKLDTSIIEYLPPKKLEGMSEAKRQIWSKITLERLLTMSIAGFDFRPEGSSYLDYCLNCNIVSVDKKIFNYSNICAYLVGVALTEAFGQDLVKVIDENIFSPLGIANYHFERCPEGYFYGASKMKMSVHDLSKIGLLLYNGGQYEGRQIISSEYVNKATAKQIEGKSEGYGYFIWMYKDGFSINGKWNQKCYCLPEKELVITYLANIQENLPELKESMENHLLVGK